MCLLINLTHIRLDHKCEMVVKSVKKCGISNKLHGTEDCMMWDGSTSEESEESSTILSSS